MGRRESIIGDCKQVLRTHSADETKAKAVAFAKTLSPGDIICFYGEMGSGKTTFIKGLSHGINKTLESQVTSPTFNYMHIYDGVPTVYHFDLYRLDTPSDFIKRGLEDFLYNKGICLIEWAEKIDKLLPSTCILITFETGPEEDTRTITITNA